MPDAEKRTEQLAWIGLLILLAIIGWRSYLFESLWLDEAVSFWVIEGGPKQVVLRALNYQGQSPLYYLLLRGWADFAGSSEAALRLPSAAAMILSAALLYALTRHWFSAQAAVVALIFLVSSDAFLRAMSARPYALALFFSILSVWALWRWLERGGFTAWLLYSLAAMLAFYAHYLFAGVMGVHLLCVLAFRPALSLRRLLWFSLALGWVLLAMLPSWPQLSLLFERQGALFFSAVPGVFDLLFALAPKTAAVYLGCGILTAAAFYARPKQPFLRAPASFKSAQFCVVFCWWLLPPVVLFVFSRLMPGSLLVDRYFLWSLPAMAVLCAWCWRSIESPAARRLALAVVLGLACLREIDRRWEVEDWRQAAQVIAGQSDAAGAPLLLYSGLIEAEEVRWLRNRRYQRYLAAPFAYYAAPGRSILLPGRLDSAVKRAYYEQRVAKQLKDEDAFLFVFLRRKLPPAGKEGIYADGVYGPLFTELGYRGQELLSQGPVRVWSFRRSQEGVPEKGRM